MKLPSIDYLYSNAKISLKQFPLTILSALVAVCIGIYLAETNDETMNRLPYINVLLCASLGIPLFFSVSILSIKNKFDIRSKIVYNLFAVLLLMALFFTFPNSESTHNNSVPYIKYAIYNLAIHLLVSFSPFLYRKQLNAFWHYNKMLFIRFLTAVMYSGFIYVGLVLALTALRLLFEVKIHEELYFDIWIFIAGFFNTWFFVSGINTDLDQLEEIDEYPKSLRIFSQYVLLPLLALYLIILYAYGAKIISTWDWPKGIVSYMIICVSVLGILAFLLLHPYGQQKDNAWIKKASKWYYFLLFPLLIILFIALFMRLNDYGITINRYLLMMLGIWLSAVCIYTAFGKTNIKFIPTSLAVMVLFISFGPWSVFSISEKSQVKRLKLLLEQSKILENGKIQNETIWGKNNSIDLTSDEELKNEGRLNDSLHNEIKSILDYLDDHHGFSLIRSWYKQDIDSIAAAKYSEKKRSYYFNEAQIYMRSMGLDYRQIYDEDIDEVETIIEYTANDNNSVIEISGYDYLMDFNQYAYDEDKIVSSFTLDSNDYTLNFFSNRLVLVGNNDSIELPLTTLIKSLNVKYSNHSNLEIPKNAMQLFATGKKYSIKIEFNTIELQKKDMLMNVKQLSGTIFIKKLNP